MKNKFEIPEEVLANLPDDVKNQLSKRKKNEVLNAVKFYGGAASIDQIIVYFWSELGKSMTRIGIGPRLCYLVKSKQLKRVAPGIYSL